MNAKLLTAAGAIALLTVGTAVAEARNFGGGRGSSGPHISSGPIGGSHGGRSAFRSGSTFKAGHIAGGNSSFARRSFSHRTGPVVGFNGDHRGHYGHHRHGSRIVIGVPYYGSYYDSGYYGGDCGWLYRKAIQTGSPYWWQRYQVCEG